MNKYMKVSAIALGMSSMVLIVSFFSLKLEQNGYISLNIAMTIIVLVIALNFYWMIRYAIKKQN